MNWYPQIGAGSVTQFPLSRSRTWRAIRNQLESGEQIVLPDNASGQIQWRLSYKDIGDDEAANLSACFTTAQGQYGAFGFVDPLSNLLAWSEDFTQPDWQLGLLTSTPGVNDPLGTQRASSISNGSPGDQQLMQTVSIPGNYVACFSAWVRSDTGGTISLGRDGNQTTVATGSAWRRVYVSGAGAAGAQSSGFSVNLGAGQSVQVWGLQVEAQPYPSQYKPSASPMGIYEETYFGADELTITSTGVGLSACEISLLSRT